MTNPILTGFHPDPSIVRVGADYFLATSTFEWFPGVQIYHSRDLVNWVLVARPLDRLDLLDLKGVPDSCGVWAPCLSHDGEQFHLVYSRVRSFDGMWKDTPNFLITAKDIKGPWSDKIYLGSQGFDGSMFHDQNGRKWYVSMLVDHRDSLFFGGIILQEYDPESRRLIGPMHEIFQGSELGITEGPHLYQKDGYYYLLTAEGGTEYGHAATMARATSILGPYEISPHHPLLSTKDFPLYPLQKTGHADLVETPDGGWFVVFLTGRPLTIRGNCPMGRETGIDQLDWPEGVWPRLASGDCVPQLEVEVLGQPESQASWEESVDLTRAILPDSYQSLRIPLTEDWAWFDKEKGCLVLKGRESLSSTFEQSLLARRVQSLNMSYELELDFHPTSFQQMAGLVCYYNTGHHYYLHITFNPATDQRCLQLIGHDNFTYQELLPEVIPLPTQGRIRLQVKWEREVLHFAYALPTEDWTTLPVKGDANILSDDYVIKGDKRYRAAFTGAFVGMACQDLAYGQLVAQFYRAIYRHHPKA